MAEKTNWMSDALAEFSQTFGGKKMKKKEEPIDIPLPPKEELKLQPTEEETKMLAELRLKKEEEDRQSQQQMYIIGSFEQIVFQELQKMQDQIDELKKR